MQTCKKQRQSNNFNNSCKFVAYLWGDISWEWQAKQKGLEGRAPEWPRLFYKGCMKEEQWLLPSPSGATVLRSDTYPAESWMYQNSSSGHYKHTLQVSALRTDRKSLLHLINPLHYLLYEYTNSFSTRILMKCVYLLVLSFVLEFKNVHTLVFSSLAKWIKESAASSQSGCLYLHRAGNKHRGECDLLPCPAELPWLHPFLGGQLV